MTSSSSSSRVCRYRRRPLLGLKRRRLLKLRRHDVARHFLERCSDAMEGEEEGGREEGEEEEAEDTETTTIDSDVVSLNQEEEEEDDDDADAEDEDEKRMSLEGEKEESTPTPLQRIKRRREEEEGGERREDRRRPPPLPFSLFPYRPTLCSKAQSAGVPNAIPFVGVPAQGRTLGVALPASIVANAQSLELRAYLVGQIARALTVYGVHEIIVYEDNNQAVKDASRLEEGGKFDTRDIDGLVPNPSQKGGWSRPLSYFVRNLRNLETPQYLRRQLCPLHDDLQYAGLQNPLDAPHHLRREEWLPFREGVVSARHTRPPFERKDGGPVPEVPGVGGCFVRCGLEEDVWVPQKEEHGTRVTVMLDERARIAAAGRGERGSWRGGRGGGGRGGGGRGWRGTARSGMVTGQIVEARTPEEEMGIYWGYRVRPCRSLQEVLDTPYDLIVGTSERGDTVDREVLEKIHSTKRTLIVFGGLGGLEHVLGDAQCGLRRRLRNPRALFGLYVNICPGQRSRTIRAEEALLIALAVLRVA